MEFAGKLYKQIIGIPVGGNACPEIADLYLLISEYDYMKNLCEGDNQNRKLAKERSNNSRYIDDVSAINYYRTTFS